MNYQFGNEGKLESPNYHVNGKKKESRAHTLLRRMEKIADKTTLL